MLPAALRYHYRLEGYALPLAIVIPLPREAIPDVDLQDEDTVYLILLERFRAVADEKVAQQYPGVTAHYVTWDAMGEDELSPILRMFEVHTMYHPN